MKLSGTGRRNTKKLDRRDEVSLLDEASEKKVEAEEKRKLSSRAASDAKTRVLKRRSTGKQNQAIGSPTARSKNPSLSNRPSHKPKNAQDATPLSSGKHFPLREDPSVDLEDDSFAPGDDRSDVPGKSDKVKKIRIRSKSTARASTFGLESLVLVDPTEALKAKARKSLKDDKPKKACAQIFKAALNHVQTGDPESAVQLLSDCRDMLAALAGMPKSDMAARLQDALSGMRGWLVAIKTSQDRPFLQLLDVIGTIASSEGAAPVALAALQTMTDVLSSGGRAEALMVAQAQVLDALLSAHVSVPVEHDHWKQQVDLTDQLRVLFKMGVLSDQISPDVKARWVVSMNQLVIRGLLPPTVREFLQTLIGAE